MEEGDGVLCIIRKDQIYVVVPQGSVLGSSLFAVGINDLSVGFSSRNLRYSTLSQFVDDATCTVADPNLSLSCSRLVERMVCWYDDNYLSLNKNKKTHVSFSNRYME